MRELMNILKDIKSGALPMSELPSFMFWAVKKQGGFLLVLIAAIVIIWLMRK